ncbi:MAG TPA: hypothetical protein ENI98_09315 [Gammaproteobacteria bacterium]|nr:hypothetical protein [Gammaproteobacteria bacterium]
MSLLSCQHLSRPIHLDASPRADFYLLPYLAAFWIPAFAGMTGAVRMTQPPP